MKPFVNTLRLYHSSEPKSSCDQLHDDFGAFPPKPLKCADLNERFNIIRTRGIGAAWQTIRVLRSLLLHSTSEPHELSPDAQALVGDSIESMRQQVDLFSKDSAIRRIFVVHLLLAILFVRESHRHFINGPRRSKTLGIFLPIRNNESDIVIYVDRIQQPSHLEEATISHEHIHLLQYKFDKNFRGAIKSADVILPEKILNSNNEKLAFLLYLLDRREMEARLHELVISFYRAYSFLPVTVPGFLGLLASNKQLGWLISDGNLSLEPEFNGLIEEHLARENSFIIQLESSLLFMKEDAMTRYITEVLPVMYGNLLNYYGDHQTAQSILNNLQRPNLYDELYG